LGPKIVLLKRVEERWKRKCSLPLLKMPINEGVSEDLVEVEVKKKKIFCFQKIFDSFRRLYIYWHKD
jgi:hypothetical protein